MSSPIVSNNAGDPKVYETHGKARAPVSAVVLTHNEAANIERCLESVAGWCQDVHVVDSGSTDRTIEIARAYSSVIHFHPFVNHAQQWAWVLRNVPLSSDWLLLLDADHMVTNRLKEEICRLLAAPGDLVDGYYSRHRFLFRGQRIRGLKVWRIRLVRHRNVRVAEDDLVDLRFIIDGRAGYLSGEVVEHNRNEDNIDFWIDKHQKYATRMALEEILHRERYIDRSLRPRLFGNPDQRTTWLKNFWDRLPLFSRPFILFAYRYVCRMGFLDGVNGLLYHFLQAFWFRLLVDMKVADFRQQIRTGKVSLAGLAGQYGSANLISRVREFPPS
jgi:glycosyltransferase involved in cell wall biosynthesis